MALIIPLPNGGSLRCEEGEHYTWGGSVHLCDMDGNEIVMWSADEFSEDAECVIGAMFSMSLTPIETLLETLKRTRVEDGCWV